MLAGVLPKLWQARAEAMRYFGLIQVKYDVWKVDASGSFVSSIKAKLWEDEVKFGIDINGDGDTGLVTIEANGAVHLKHGDNTYNGAPQYYIVDGS